MLWRDGLSRFERAEALNERAKLLYPLFSWPRTGAEPEMRGGGFPVSGLVFNGRLSGLFGERRVRVKGRAEAALGLADRRDSLMLGLNGVAEGVCGSEVAPVGKLVS